MRTVSYRLADLPNVKISLGFVGENEHTRVQFDAKKIFEQYPDAIPALTVQPPKGDAYPAVITLDGDMVIWDVSDSDLAYQGMGEIQLVFTEGEKVAKSYIAKTRISRSIVPTGEVPTPVENWMAHAAEVLEEVDEAIPTGGTTGQVLAKKSDADRDTEWVDQTGGGGGTSNYNDLSNKPQIGGVTLSGNKTLHDLGAAAEEDIPDVHNVPAGGSANQVLAKASGTDYDLKWVNQSGGGGGGAEIDDTAGEGDTDVVWSADKTWTENEALKEAIAYKTPEEYGAKGDGTTDDSQAVQDAIDAGYGVRFGDNKTYYIPTPIEIDHDVKLIGGENTVIKTETVSGSLNNVFVVSGTLKKTTTLTTDYTSEGNTDNSGNMFTLDDMDGIDAGDIIVVKATDQYYSYARQYYYLGMTLLVGDKDDDHLYTTESMPFDMTLTENVSVMVYSAPTVIIENLNFVGDRESIGHYKYFVTLDSCKNSVIRNCGFSEMDNGIRINHSVNTLIDRITMSDGKNDNTIPGDGYGIQIDASTNTFVQGINAICAQTPITTGGDVLVANLYVRDCDLTSQCRHHGVGLHENTYNLVVEDCTLGGLNVLGTGTVSRCRFVNNRRLGSRDGGITFCGNHNPKFASLRVKECIFEGSSKIYIYSPSTQSPVQSFDCLVGLVDIRDCVGGYLCMSGTVDQYILSNRVLEMNLVRWKNCNEFYRQSASDIIENLVIADCEFIQKYWINDHNDSHGLALANIYNMDVSSTIPNEHRVRVDKDTMGEMCALPAGTQITLASSNNSAKFIVCGKNICSDDPADYLFGTVSGSDGGTLTRTVTTGSDTPTLTTDDDGNLVYTQKNNTSTYTWYPVGLFYINETGQVVMSAKLKNTGLTDPASFRPYIAMVDCSTGKLISRYTGTVVQATEQGATISLTKKAPKNSVAMCYYTCSTAVANAETTFAEMKAEFVSDFAPTVSDEPYEAVRRTGDGTVYAIDGVNNIMCSELNFHVQYGADYVDNPIGVLPSGTGVSF